MHNLLAELCFLATVLVSMGVGLLIVNRYRICLGSGRPAYWAIPAVLLTGISLLMMLDGPIAPMGFLLCLIAALALVVLWFREFLALMAMGDDCFPGRFDKVLWFAILVLAPPLGLVAFATFRRSYWAVEKPSAGRVSEEWA